MMETIKNIVACIIIIAWFVMITCTIYIIITAFCVSLMTWISSVSLALWACSLWEIALPIIAFMIFVLVVFGIVFLTVWAVERIFNVDIL